MISKPVEFDVLKFRKRFPKFSDPDTYNDDLLQMVFEEACEYVPAAIVPYDPDNGVYTRELLIFTVMCHFLQLQDMAEDGMPGRIASASQGSVSTSFDLVKTSKASDDFWLQTPCGQRFWQLMRRYALGSRFIRNTRRHPFG